MTYNEWRDELRSNLLSVSEGERRRVLDYYAEAYADRRDAGFSENEIIAEFGAPYDAAKKILQDGGDDGYFGSQNFNRNANSRNRNGYGGNTSGSYGGNTGGNYNANYANTGGNYNANYANTSGNYNYCPPKEKNDYTWVFVLLCVIFAAPIFGITMGLVGITIGIICAPFGIMISGVATIGAGIGLMFHDAVGGMVSIGAGMFLFGFSLILFPLCGKLIKLMWTLFKKLFLWVKGLFGGREKRV